MRYIYPMKFVGWAKEIEKGQEVDPLKWNEVKKKYENVEWVQTKEYYFCTATPSKQIFMQILHIAVSVDYRTCYFCSAQVEC